MKTLDEEITDTCLIDEVENEMMEAKELSGTIVECINHISSVILEKTEGSRLTSSASRELELIEVEMVCTNKSSITKSGAPALESKRSGSPPISSPSEPIIAPTIVA